MPLSVPPKLHRALELFDEDAAPLLTWLESGDPGVLVPYGYGDAPDGTLLHLAAARGATDVVAALVDRGVDPNARDLHGDPPLYHALARAWPSRPQIVDALLAAGADPFVRSGRGHALHWACRAGRLDLVERLVAGGIPIDIRTPDGMTPLHFAVYHPEVVEWLLDRHAATCPTGASTSPLGRAFLDIGATPGVPRSMDLLARAGARVGHEEQRAVLRAALWDGKHLVQRAVALGADLDGRDAEGRTLLLELLDSVEDPALVARLLEVGADATVLDGEGRSALDLLDDAPYDEEDQAELRALLEDAGAEPGSGGGEDACEAHFETLYLAAEDGGDTLAAVSLPCVPEALQAAVRFGSAAVVEKLFARGARWTWLPGEDIYEIVRTGPTELLEQLLQAGLDAQWRGPEGNTLAHGPLDHHLHDEVPERLRLALDAGVPVDATNDAGWTPLMMALSGMHTSECGETKPLASIHMPAGFYGVIDDDAIALLLASGASLLARTPSGHTVLHAASTAGRLDLVERCLDAGVPAGCVNDYGRTALHEAARHGRTEICRLLVERGAPLDASDCRGATALHLAAGGLKVEACLSLLELGADVEAHDVSGHSPLLVAAEVGLPPVSRALIARGADVEARDHRRRTALHAACESHNHGATGEDPTTGGRPEPADVALEGVDLLLEAGARHDAEDVLGRTPLHVAAGQRFLEREDISMATCRRLLEAGADRWARNRDGRTPAGVAHSKAVKRLVAPGS